MYDQFRFNSESHPQVVVTKVSFLGEFQIEQGRGKGECDMNDFDNDVISITIGQAVELARQILKLAGEI